jgi:hypothetical protein
MGITHFRMELKYRVPPERTADLRRRLPPGSVRRYAMTTTYLDRDDGALSEAARRAPQQATKVRLREYWGSDDALWMEVKLRRGSWTRKWRFPVPKARVPDLLHGLDPRDLVPPRDDGAQGTEDLRETFRRLWEGGVPLRALGCVTVHRTHFGYPKEQVRFSLDEEVAYYRAPVPLYPAVGTLDPSSLGTPIRRESDGILELKDAGCGPGWCRDVVDGLQSTPYSKFGTLLSCLDRG